MEILSYEELKSRCMAAMPEGIDTREGSLIDTAVGPVCAELASAYLTLSELLRPPVPRHLGGRLPRPDRRPVRDFEGGGKPRRN